MSIDRTYIDSLLIKAAKDGSQAAFAKLFNYYYKWIYNFVKSIVLDVTESEDLTMMTFEKAFRKIKEYVFLCEFRTWLFTIARNTCMDFVRSKKCHPSDFVELQNVLHLSCEGETPEDIIIKEETTKMLEASVECLPDVYKNVILSHYYEDQLCRDISQEQCISINTVVGQLVRARQYLHMALEKKLA